MSDSLIINARHHLQWHTRLFSDTSTAMMWGCWLYLWRPVVSTLNWVANMGFGVRPFAALASTTMPISWELSAMALVGASGSLLLWNLLPTRKARETHKVQNLSDYATHFQLPEHHIAAGRETSVCVVHHDAEGRIVHIEAKA